MPITISILKSPDNILNSNATVTFAEDGGTIGRGVDNNWTLEDPERFISTKHSQIKYENGRFYLLDLSTNGTFYNGSDEPIGKGNKIALTDGDKFSFSEYEFHISFNGGNPGGTDNLDDFMDAGPFGDFSASSQADDDIFSFSSPAQGDDSFTTGLPGYSQSSDPLFAVEEVEADPLIALDKARGEYAAEQAEPEVFSTSYAEQSDVMSQSISWPSPVADTNGIPDDWDDLLDIEPVPIPQKIESPLPQAVVEAAPVQVKAPAPIENAIQQPSQREHELEAINKALLTEIEKLKKANVSQKLVMVGTGDDRSVIEAMGISHQNLSNEKIAEINQVVGEMVKETIAGLMKVLSSRSSIKNEFRMNVTTIQPVENNPLKFSANAEDAMENMFIKEGNAYKKPVEAVREGFIGIAEHQVAILAGIRAAFKGVIERFDPITLEQRFEKYRKSGLIQVGNKGKNWDAYQTYYKELVDDLDNSFQHLFGYEFVQAYEDQLQRLAVSRNGL